tara:strand:+ start:2676 stop:3638 length:963 start_codon:yes stop_codon:yes gene_type:complete
MNYFPISILPKKIILIDGIARSGKLFTGTLLSTFKNYEHMEFGLNFERLCPALEFKKINEDFAKSFINNYLNELIYNKYLSRNVNFRPTDRTSVVNTPNYKLYKKRLKMKEGYRIIKQIKQENKSLLFVTHDILSTINAFNKLGLSYKMIELFRNPFSLVMSWYKRGLGRRFGNDQRLFSLLIKKKRKILPWYDNLFNDNLRDLNELEKCIHYVYNITTKSISNYTKLNKLEKKRIFITSYERLVENPYSEISNISIFLKSELTKNTKIFIKKENLPKLLNNSILKKNRLFIKSEVNRKYYNKLEKLEQNFNKSIYGLSK